MVVELENLNLQLKTKYTYTLLSCEDGQQSEPPLYIWDDVLAVARGRNHPYQNYQDPPVRTIALDIEDAQTECESNNSKWHFQY